MRVNKNYWLAAGGTLAVAGAMIMFSAHRIEAQYSSPVRVMNTSSGPALNSSVDDPGRVAYQSGSFPNASPPTNSVTFNFPPVPANHRLVVQHLSGNLTFSTNGTAVIQSVGTNFFASSMAGLAAFDQPVLMYFEPGLVQVLVSGLNNQTFSGLQTLNMTGYMLDCSAAPCSAIAH